MHLKKFLRGFGWLHYKEFKTLNNSINDLFLIIIITCDLL